MQTLGLRLLIGLLFILGSCTPRELDEDLYLREFFNLNTSGKIIGIVQVANINNEKVDKKFINTLSIEFQVIEVLYKGSDHKNFSEKKLNCQPLEMYGYWKVQALDMPIDVKINKSYLVYLSFIENRCVINFISKIHEERVFYSKDQVAKELSLESFRDRLKKWMEVNPIGRK